MAVEPSVISALEAIYAGASADSKESETLDFKQENARSAGDTERELVQATLCFANTYGGNTVVGVRDRPGGPDALIGTAIDARTLKQRIFELTNPHLAVDVEPVEFEGVRLLVIRAPESPEIHADSQGRAPRRINTDCINMSPAEQTRHREDRRGSDWSALAGNRSLSEVSPRAISIARELLAAHSERDHSALARLDDADLLLRLGALRQDGRLSRAGEVLFCPTADGSDRLVYMYRETPAGEPTDRRRFDDALLIAYEGVMSLVDPSPGVRSDPCERLSRPGSWTRKEPIAREAQQAYAGADHSQAQGG